MKNAIISLTIVLIFFSYTKDKVPQIDPNVCKDEMFNNKEIRMNGVWELQSNSNVPGLYKIEFLNDSILHLLPLSEDSIWKVMKYRMSCNVFEHDKYWITDPGPFQNWYTFNSSYNSNSKIWLLTQYNFIGGGGYDSAFFLKK